MGKTTLIFITLILLVNFSFAQWQQTNGPYGGVVKCISQNKPTNTIFAGTHISGLYRYQSSLNKWEYLYNKLPVSGIDEIAVLDSIVFVGSYNGTTDKKGLFKSLDNGNTWDTIMIDSTTSTRGVDNVFCNDSLLIVSEFYKLFFSDDSGLTFNEIGHNLTDTANDFIGIIMKDDRLFALYNISHYGSTISYSDDHGQTWHKPTTNILSTYFFNGVRVFGNKIYAFGSSCLYVSNDNGYNWIDITPSGLNLGYSDVFVSNDTILLASHGGVYKSVNSGNTYQPSSNGLPLQTLWTVQFLKSAHNGLLLSTDLGVFRTSDLGDTWNDFNNNFHTNTFSIAVFNNEIYVGTFNNGIFSSADNGDNWVVKNSGLEFFGYFQRSKDITSLGNRLIIGTDNEIFYSDDNASSWIHTSNGLTSNDIIKFHYDHGLLYAGTSSGIFYSADSSATWHEITNGPDCFVPDLLVDDNLIIAEDVCFNVPPQNSTTQIERSDNYGASFTTFDTPMVLVDIEKIDTVILAASWLPYLVKSFDNGHIWVLDSAFGHTVINDIYVISSEFIFVATANRKIYFSSDTAKTWVDITGDFDGIASRFVKYGNYLYVSSLINGVWKRDISDLVGINENPIAENNLVVFPNPFSDNITFQLPETMPYINLSLYDVYSRLVSTTNESNTNKITLQNNELPKGIYFYRLTSKSYVVKTGKIIKN